MNPTTYALSINAGASGLTNSLTGEAVVLSVNGSGVVEGRTAIGGLLVFTVSVAANGDVTLDQSRAVIHGTASDPDTSEGKSLAADNLVVLTATVTDKDGDQAHAAVNIGQNLNFLDDGPTVGISETEATLTVDETNLAANDTKSFAGAFTQSFGHDGPAASGSSTWTLGINLGATGLTDSLTGEAVVLSVNGSGAIEGRTATTNVLVFTVSVDGSGNVTLDQARAVIHGTASDPDTSEGKTLAADNLVTLTYTITDADGDSAHATINIGQNLNFLDDGPTISPSGSEATLTVDETNFAINDTQSFASAFTKAFGNDGPATLNPTTYALGINAGASGLVDTLTGEAVVLSVNGSGVVEGRTATTSLLVFTVSVAANGDVTLDQSRAVVHSTSSEPDTSEGKSLAADNLVTLTATVTDKDGDQAHATINIGQNLNLLDDGPTATGESDNVASGVSTATGNVITGVDFVGGDANTTDGNADNPGHDGFGGIVSIHSNGTSTTDSNPAGGFTVTGSYGSLQMDVNGNYTYTRAGGSAGNVSETFTYTYKDGDGDTATATLTISITNSTPTANAATVWLDDDALAGGNTGGTGDRTPDVQGTPGTLTASGGDGDIDFFLTASQTLPTGFTSVLSSLAGVQTLQISQNGTLVITVTLTNETGDYTVVQNAPIMHALDGNTEGEIPLGNIVPEINVSFFAQDVDGSQSAPKNIVITVDDDTPTVTLAAVTEPQLTVDESNLAANAGPTSFASLFTQSFGADGAAAVGSSTWALGINAGASGLIDSLTGEAVVLSVNGSGAVEGRTTTTNLLVFTVTVDSSGNVSLDQARAVMHSTASDPDTSEDKSLAADNLVTLTHTITDKDGDSASATANIGQNLHFLDDGPTISPSGTEAQLTVDESNFAVNDTKGFATAFTKGFGNDGPATLNPTTYALSINAGASGLTDSLTGELVVLSVNVSGAVEGRTATTNLLVFTVSVAANGDVTLDQARAVIHGTASDPDTSEGKTLAADNLVVLTATVTDKDGDQAHAAVNIGQNLNFNDDGPTISASGTEATLTVDETTLAVNDTQSFASAFTKSFGADGPATLNPTTYALSINAGASGLADSLTGELVVLSVNVSGAVEGRTATTNLLVFTVSVAANGDVTLDQARAVIHGTASDPDTSEGKTLAADNLVVLTATVTDKDGDQAHAAVNIGQNLNFNDDGPTAAVGTTGQTISVDESVGVQVDSKDTTDAGVIALFSGVTLKGTDTDLPQYATNTNAIVNSTGTLFGTDGGTAAFSLNVSSAGVNSWPQHDRRPRHPALHWKANLIVGRVSGGTDDGKAAFAIAIDNTGHISMVECLSIQHNSTRPTRMTPSPSRMARSWRWSRRPTPTTTPARRRPPIGSLISFQDSGPVMTAASNINIQNSGDVAHTGAVRVQPGCGWRADQQRRDQDGRRQRDGQRHSRDELDADTRLRDGDDGVLYVQLRLSERNWDNRP